ncbi:MAG: hypothetical protein AAGA46_13650 [Cyanobacteria bacterium P01_F01_bin.13]
MNKFILGSILAAISLMAIYGTSASDRVTSWVDGTESASSQSDFGQSEGADDNAFISLNSTEADRDAVTDINRTPLEKAGDIPQRQTIGVTSNPNFGVTASPNTDDTGGGVVQPNPSTAQTPPAQTSPGATSQTRPANQAPGQTSQSGEVIRALW